MPSAPLPMAARGHLSSHGTTRARRCVRTGFRGLLFACLCTAVTQTAAQGTDASGELPAISIIIDDLGYRRLDGLRALELPGPVAYAVLPHTPYASRLATIAFQLDKEVLLHVPMQSELEKALGPGALTNAMAQREIRIALEAGMASVPHVSGINNHMGSALTQQTRAMGWLMDWMNERGELYFVDSITSARSVALSSASEAGLSAIGRDVFLDDTADAGMIAKQFQRLIALARERGTGLAIGHPYPETLGVLRKVLVKPSYYGVQLVSVRELIARRSKAKVVRSTLADQNHSDTAHYANNSTVGDKK
jgi:polysaccharide deacetylase 2 family uncharacterized protein YibQ